MGFEVALLPLIFFSLACCVLVTLFFRHFGAFRFHWIVWSMMILSAIIPFVMVVGILPYDISRCLFGKLYVHSKELHLLLDVLYWISFVLTWVVNPLLVSFLRYPYSIGIKQRLWLTVKENLIFWGSILGVVVVGVTILLATHKMTVSNLFPLAISLANGYGLLVLCLTLGYGFVALPRKIWKEANPASSYLYCLQDISMQTSNCAKNVADGKELLKLCDVAREKFVGNTKEVWQRKGEKRVDRLQRLINEMPIPELSKDTESKNRKIKKLKKAKWETYSPLKLQGFLELLEDVCQSIEFTSFYVTDASKTALFKLRLYNSTLSIPLVILKRIGAVILFGMNLCCLWGEITLIFNNKYSFFYMVSHVSIPQTVNIIFITTPILAYMMFVGSWSLRHLRIGSFFRFIPGSTNSNTLNYFAVILCRLGPTIGFHYMQQIGAYDSEFQKVMGVMDVVVFIGTKWNTYSPLLLLIIMIVASFQIINRIMIALKMDIVTYDPSLMNHDSLRCGEDVLCQLNANAKDLISYGLSYKTILENTNVFKKKVKYGRPEDTLLNNGAEDI